MTEKGEIYTKPRVILSCNDHDDDDDEMKRESCKRWTAGANNLYERFDRKNPIA